MLAAIGEWINTLVDYFYRLVLTFFDFFKDFFWWILDNLFGVVVAIINGIDFGLDAINPINYISSIPPETMHYMSLCGFNECISIIVIALGIRFLLQIIPFVRLGS